MYPYFRMQQSPQPPQLPQPATPRAQAGVAGEAATVPQTRAQLDALMHQRSELREQLQALGRRRNQLDEQRHVTPQPGRAAIEARIAELDVRVARIDRQIMQADDAIAEAIARGVGAQEQTGVQVVTIPPIPDIPPIPRIPGSGLDGEGVAALVVGEALFFILLGTVLYRRLKRRFQGQSAGGGADLAKMEQLQQSVDVIAVEVERIAEGQRFTTKLLSERAAARVAGGGSES